MEISFIFISIFNFITSVLIQNINNSGLLPDTILISRFIIYILLVGLVFLIFLKSHKNVHFVQSITGYLKENFPDHFLWEKGKSCNTRKIHL